MCLPKAADPIVVKETPHPPESTQLQRHNVVSSSKPKGKPSKREELRQSGGGSESPIPKRAKFIKKFGASKTSSAVAKKKPSKISKAKLTAEAGKMKLNPEQKVSAKQRKKSTEPKPRERKVSKTKEKRVIGKKREESGKRLVSSEQNIQRVSPLKLPQAKEEVGSDPTPSSNYDILADRLAEEIIKESITMQGKYKLHGIMSACSTIIYS